MKKGFTLIELILYIVISGTILIGASIVYTQVNEVKVEQEVRNSIDLQANRVIRQIDYLISQSTGINSPTIGNSGNSLSLEMADTAKNPTIISLTSEKIYITEGSGSTRAITNSNVRVTNLSFENISHVDTFGNIKYTIEIEFVNDSNKQEYNYSNTFESSTSVRY